jgi:hypothetical protein
MLIVRCRTFPSGTSALVDVADNTHRHGHGMSKAKVFVSFDFDNDRVLRDFIIGQANLSRSPFTVSDYSLKEAKRQAVWEARARTAISRSDKVVVMLGPRTRFASGVRKEIAMAVALGKPRIQVIGYAHGTRAWAVPSGGRVYRWNWDNLARLLAPPGRSFAQRWYST